MKLCKKWDAGKATLNPQSSKYDIMIADSNRPGSNFVNEEAASDVPGEPRKQTTFQKQFFVLFLFYFNCAENHDGYTGTSYTQVCQLN